MNFLVLASNSFIKLTHNLAAVLLATAVALVFYQVITRFGFGSAAVWSEIIARAGIIWSVFLVFGAAIRLGKMIPIDAIKHMAPLRIQIWLTRLAAIATLLTLSVFVWFGVKMTLLVAEQQIAMINISFSWLYAALPIGSALAMPAVFLALIDSEKSFRNKNKANQ